ncbi:MAG: uracil-DNA glycosylase [Sphaerochaetaceae bacterium]|nr:uracil-DNA glycosylase [Sphaerochaetaceae bacterium]
MDVKGAITELDNIMDLYEAILKKKLPVKPQNKDFSSVAAKIEGEKAEDKTIQSMLSDIPDDFSQMDLNRLSNYVSTCTRCGLCKTRTNTVFGEGCSNRPKVMVIGEGPGEKEDLTGRPFVGLAGEYLDKWLKAIGLSRETNTYIANVVKCRPPQNRDPKDDEKEACKAFLYQQIALVMPSAILCVGKPASTLMTGKMDATMASLREKLFLFDSSIPMVCTYHPAAVLRNMELRRPVWEDLKRLSSIINPQIRG